MQTLVLLTSLVLSNTAPITKIVDENKLTETVREQVRSVQEEVIYKVKISASNNFLVKAKQVLLLAKNNQIIELPARQSGE